MMDELSKQERMRKIHNNLRRYGKIIHDEHYSNARVQMYDVSKDNMLYHYCMVVLIQGEVEVLRYFE